ncbi:FtsX-like permease family protein [Rhodocytophaga rosea]|uniref:FtsX-like permease family protein n=1 Tax=Rhodocytophaga rosea TaxID=2704465 RepID=A0A6C0GGF5_9BACT|nr:ABC transporter permease [Rhodocytophaga rosea]QHT67037.1 FtsX-like permease family protein [Rhodocytophaga rosea]
MLRNYLTIAYRNLTKHKAFSFTNSLGLAVGMAACLLVLQYVVFEFSYDSFHTQADHIYRLAGRRFVAGQLDGESAQSYHAAGPTLQKEVPGISQFTRLRSWYGNTMVSHIAGQQTTMFQPVVIRTKQFTDSTSVLLAGNFNGWNPNENPMQREGNEWVARLNLVPGKYSYKFVVNGNWVNDKDNPLVDTTDNNNSLFFVAETENYKKAAQTFREVSFKEDGIYFADATFFNVFTFPLIKGNPKTALHESNSVVISESIARKHFGSEDPMGKLISFRQNDNAQPKLITGVFKDVPANSHLQFNFLLSYRSLGSDLDMNWQWFQTYTYVVLAPGVKPAEVEANFPAIIDKYRGPALQADNAKEELFLQPLQQIHLYSDLKREIGVNNSITTIYFLLIIATFILILAWVNYINLSTARSIERAKEVGIRKVVGASRSQLIGQFMAESLVLNVLAAVFAMTLVQVALPYFNDFTGQQMPLTLWKESTFWLLFIGLFMAGTLFSGLYPAFALSSFQPVSVVKGKWRSSASGIMLRKSLVVFQFVISVLLITGTFTVYRQIDFMQNQDLGINIDQIMVVKSPFIVNNKQFSQKFDVFRNQVLQYPNVRHFASTDVVPGMEDMYSDNGIKREGSEDISLSMFSLIWADYDFISTYGIKLLAGRAFSKDFSTDKEGAIINEAAAKALGFASAQEAVNNNIMYGKDNKYKVVGVINNYHQKTLKSDYVPMIFLLNPQDGRCYSIKIEAKDAGNTVAAIEKAYQSVFPGNPFEYFFLDEFFDSQYKTDRHFRRIFTLFATLAIFVACLGLLGLASFATVQRTKEIGIRKILGASVNQIIYLLSKDFLGLVLLANLIAWPLAYWAMYEWLSTYAFRININPWLFIIPSILVFVIALLTVSLQTIKSAKSNPVKSLRYE